MEFVCQNCKKSTSNLSRCTGCYRVYYCSKVCQKANWKSGHREQCKKSKLVTKTTEAYSCDKKETEKESKPREKDDSGFEEIASGVQKTDPEVKSSTSDKCNVCSKTGNLKRCANCKKASYCSKTCQRRDWAQHKNVCESEFDGHIKTKGFIEKEIEKEREREREEFKEKMKSSNLFCFNSIANAGDRTFLPFVDLLAGVNDVNLAECRKASDKDFNRAISTAKTFYPFLKVIDNLDYISSEFFGMRPRHSFIVLVGFISRYHHYRQRHCVYVEDRYGQELYVAFYLDFDNPCPYFTWSDLRPGRFICIRDPYRHYFLDGSVGIRVDEASDVNIFNA